MRYRNFVCAAALGLFFLPAIASAQTPRPRTTPRATPRPTPAATTAATPAPRPQQTPPPPGALAVVNGQTLTLADLDPKVRQVVEDFEQNMPNLRRDALDARINQLLLDTEAQKRKVSREQLMDAEVNNRVTEPTEAEIKAVYDANKQQIGDADMGIVRPQIVKLPARAGRGRSWSAISYAHARRDNRRAGHRHQHAEPRARDRGHDRRRRSNHRRRLRGAAQALLYKLRREIFDAETRALDMKINQILLEAEAKKRNQTPEAIFKAEVADKLASRPTPK